MKLHHMIFLPYFITLTLLIGCESRSMDKVNVESSYNGTASVSNGSAKVSTSNLFQSGHRVAAIGTVKARDNSSWTVPAEVNYTNRKFPMAPDLYNPHGKKFDSAAMALAAFNSSDIIDIDSEGEVITGYIFADNYFELYINGVPVGKDSVPFTQFNSSIVKFKVSRPFTIAMKLVDWEENLGLGTERNRGIDNHPGDGGMVAVFKDEEHRTLAETNNKWKAQTFYTSPIINLSCALESGTKRSSLGCITKGSDENSPHYGLHWKVPSGWMKPDFDDSKWPTATTYTNSDIGVDNKKSYTNFTDIFDDKNIDAQFIWSTNVILDNEVIVRYKVL